jgi:uncharacterized protein YcbX
MKIISLVEYPVKSFPGISRQSVLVNLRGLGLDRRYMLIDANNNFLTQRTLPQLTQFDVNIDETLSFSFKGSGDSIMVSSKSNGAKLTVRVWQDSCSAVEVNGELSNWFSEQLGQAVRLVYMEDEDVRDTDPKYSKPGDQVGFADGFPILVTTQSSLDELNKRLINPIPMDRFRANIVLDGLKPFTEDDWQEIRIGDVVLRVAKPCARCQVITTDQRTGEQHPEPLTALSEFRKKDHKVLFGMNFIPETFGEISLGSQVKVI